MIVVVSTTYQCTYFVTQWLLPSDISLVSLQDKLSLSTFPTKKQLLRSVWSPHTQTINSVLNTWPSARLVHYLSPPLGLCNHQESEFLIILENFKMKTKPDCLMCCTWYLDTSYQQLVSTNWWIIHSSRNFEILFIWQITWC